MGHGTIVRPHIIAEVVRDAGEDFSHRDESLAGRFAGPNVEILTREEVLMKTDGRAILRGWESGIDTSFYLATARMEREWDDGSKNVHTRGNLHLVREGEAGISPFERAAGLIKRAARLQLESAELIERAGATWSRSQSAGRGQSEGRSIVPGESPPGDEIPSQERG